MSGTAAWCIGCMGAGGCRCCLPALGLTLPLPPCACRAAAAAKKKAEQ